MPANVPPLHFVGTIGIDYRVKYTHVANERVKLQLWDTAGQDRVVH